MNGLFTKIGRAGGVAAVILLAAAVGGAFAQTGKRKTPGSDICVAKSLTNFEDANYTTIQAAVNAARPGQVIEILDEGTYEEQVTIYGEDDCKWTGVTGGKNGITIRYVPAGGAGAAWNHARPTIKYRDTKNTSPKNKTEAGTSGDQVGTSGNFETCGALRVLRAKGVTIEGIAVDGGGAFAFGAENVWHNNQTGKDSHLFHGNAAIALAVAGAVTIRDCDLKNAYFGISIKDRNTGGVFGNPNPSDNDVTVPLSGFGKVGGHLFEYNKVNSNVCAFFFESAWDLGSTVRYNLIYNNKVNKSLVTGLPEPNNQNGGAFMFKDMYLSPVAIYNNTLYDNTGNFLGNWQVGGQHLIFNNIFSKSTPSQNPGNDHMSLDGKFPFRMHNNVFSIDASKVQAQCQSNYNCAANSSIAPGGCFVAALQDNAAFPQVQGTQTTITNCSNSGQTERQNIVSPGYVFTSMKGANNANIAIPAANEIRWLQTEGGAVGQSGQTTTLPTLFKSLVATSADFLVPDWDNDLVVKYIKNKGWAAAGIRNNDGQIADLGAIPSTGVRQTTIARIVPTDVVILTGSGTSYTGKVKFNLKLESGDFTGLSVKMLRWIAPIPDNKQAADGGESGGDWPSRMIVVPSSAIHNISNPTLTGLKVGSNTGSFTTEGATTNTNYGFFEIVIQGTDANGKTVTSDIGFLPYRKLEYTFEMRVLDGTQATTTVVAGKKYSLEVTVKHNGTTFTQRISEVAYDLLSDPTAFMYTDPEPKNPLVYDSAVTFPKTYPNVYFTRADPNETISASGVYVSGTNRLPILGTLDIVVRPGTAERVEFKDPISLTQLGNGQAPVINRGVERPVLVEVQDRYGNAVDVVVPVTIVSDKPEIGDVAAKTVSTDAKTGVATFTAVVTNGKTGDTFDMTATIADGKYKDKDNIGRLRLGRAMDRLDVFYADTAFKADGKTVNQDLSVGISGNVNDWFKVTVRVIVSDTINKAQTGKSVKVDPSDDGLVFSATSGGAAATEFQLTNGVATFYVSATKEVKDGCVYVDAYTATGALDGGIGSGTRCNIDFIKPSSSILNAVVYGDGHGRPDSLLIHYFEGDAKFGSGPGAAPKPTKVTLAWPTVASGVVLTANADAITVRGDYLLHVNLAGAALTGATARPRGYTEVERKIVTVFGEEEDDGFDVIDGIGPVIAVDNDDAHGGNPVLTENVNAGTDNDKILIKVSEQLRNPDMLKGRTLLYTRDANPSNEPGASGGEELEVVDAYLDGTNAYTVEVKPVSGGLKVGDWIRFNPSGGVTDRAKVEGVIDDNKPHSGNRWAQLKIQEVAPSVKEAWYTSNSVTGKPDYAYVRFDKNVVLADWFSDGSVNFGKNDVVKVADVGLSSLFKAGGDTLIIDLAVAFKSSQTGIRTSEDMPFTLGYASGKKTEWEGVTGADVQATDRAKPVLADTVFLYIGDTKEDGTTTDTLRVTYSERPSDAALKLERPVTIMTGGGGCEPVLTLLGQVAPAGGNSRFYKATYLVEGDLAVQCPAFPKTGDMVRIDSKANIGDDRQPSNIQDVADNLRQPLKVIRELKWTIKVKNNPFKKGIEGRDSMTIVISPSVPPGVEKEDVKLDATILIFDNLGALVVKETLEGRPGEIAWKWGGTNQKGRLVGTGTYLFKALCKGNIGAGADAETVQPSAPFVKPLGVVR